MSDEPTVTLAPGSEGVAVLQWTDTADSDALRAALSKASEAAVAQGVHRLEAAATADDLVARRALLRSGFRQEGVRRQAVQRPDGSYGDEITYARLASDETAGPGAFTAVMNSALPRTRVIAHAIMRAADGRFVLCRTTFKPDWELPGGIVEARETPRAGAAREISEEFGVEWPIGRLLLVDWLPPYLGWDDALELIFDAGEVTQADLDAFVLDDHEIAEVRLVTLAEAAELVTPLSHRRLALIAGLGTHETVHSEDGHPAG